MGFVGDSYKCPLCGWESHGGYFNDGVGYPICTVDANSCLGKISEFGSNPCDIVGAALRCILKGTSLFLRHDICKNVGAFLTPNQQMVVLLYKQWLRSVLSSEKVADGHTKHGTENLRENNRANSASWRFHGIDIHAPPLDVGLPLA